MTTRPGILLDISRMRSRLGRGALTGIDRVEAEWLRHLQGRNHLLLCRVPGGQLLLPPEAGAALLRWFAGDTSDLPQAGLLDRLRGRGDLRARATRGLRRMAVLASSRGGRGLGRAAADKLGPGAVYLNLGHANFDRRLFGELPPLRRVVLIHDTIPLDHPEFTRAGQTETFRVKFMVAVGMADLLLTVSEASSRAVQKWRARLAIAKRAPVRAALIGTTLATPDERGIPAGLDLTRPFFVTLGTIEPRKNHALLLDVWEELARRLAPADMPQLFIIGRRGWENQATFARLDALPASGPVIELNGLDDGAVAALLMRSHALLMPSRAEGFGLPLTEAADRGVPVIAAPLPAGREVLGDYAIWLGPDDRDGWADAVQRIGCGPPERLAHHASVTWAKHFKSVYLSLMEPDE